MTNLILFEKGELRSLIRSEVEQAVANAMTDNKAQKKTASKYLTRQEAANMLKISLSTLQRLVNQQHLTARKVGRKTLFLLSDVHNTVLTLNK